MHIRNDLLRSFSVQTQTIVFLHDNRRRLVDHPFLRIVFALLATVSDGRRYALTVLGFDFPDLPEEIRQRLTALDIPDKLRRYAEDMTALYYANKQDDCEYAVFPVANFNACYGSTTFSKKKLPQLPQSVFVREERHGLCRLKVIL